MYQGIRIGFCGPLGGGKTTTAQRLADLYRGSRLSFAYPLKAVARGMAASQGKPAPDRAVFQALSDYRDGDTWLDIMGYVLDAVGPDRDIFVDDMRFPDEAEMLRDRGFMLVRLHVPQDSLNLRRMRRDGKLPDQARLDHYSESFWATMDVDATVYAGDSVATVCRNVLESWACWRTNQAKELTAYDPFKHPRSA